MARLNFSYRSKKPKANLEVRLSYWLNGKRKFQHARTQIETTKKFWQEYKDKGERFRDADKVKERDTINAHLKNLKDFIENELPRVEEIEGDWLKNTVYNYYYPKAEKTIPDDLIEYWGYYMDLREYELKQKPRSWQKWKEIKNRVAQFQETVDHSYSIGEVDEEFKRDWVEFCKKQKYANATIKKNLTYVKMICKHAERKGIEVSNELDNLKVNFKKENLPKIYLSFDELKQIKKIENLPDYLDNARDWLLISCYTGQRVSDFMRFKTSMIRESKTRKFIDVSQRKTDKKVSIPLLPPVENILQKHKGKFPRALSPQKYNSYIKEVGKIAGLDTLTKGKILKKVAKDKNRKVLGSYPKYKLITSHIGRRSLATNYYGIIPSSYLKNITGHGTEAMLLSYIGKTSKDTAFEAYDLMLNFEKTKNEKIQIR
jgi:site-specific recombinase XerD